MPVRLSIENANLQSVPRGTLVGPSTAVKPLHEVFALQHRQAL